LITKFQIDFELGEGIVKSEGGAPIGGLAADRKKPANEKRCAILPGNVNALRQHLLTMSTLIDDDRLGAS